MHRKAKNIKIIGKSRVGMSYSFKDALVKLFDKKSSYIVTDPKEDWSRKKQNMCCTEDLKSTILFEIYKRFENSTHFPDKKFTSGPEELKRIVHEVVTENPYINQDNIIEESFLLCITEIFDDIALNRNNCYAQKFQEKYEEYIQNQLFEIRSSHKIRI